MWSIVITAIIGAILEALGFVARTRRRFCSGVKVRFGIGRLSPAPSS